MNGLVHGKLQLFGTNIQLIQEMPKLQQQNHIKRQYSRITLKNKVTLIRLVFRKAIPLDQAIDSLGLKKTTALNIIKRYKETGSLPMRKFKRSKKKVPQSIKIKKEEVESNEEEAQKVVANEAPSNTINPIFNPMAYCPFDYQWYSYPYALYQLPS